MRWNITFTLAAFPQFLQNPVAWIQKNVWNLPALFDVQNNHGPLLCTLCPKKMDPGDLVTIIVIQFGDNP
jgi:hypothetical protein